MIIDVNISYDVMVLEGVTSLALKWKTKLFYFLKWSKFEYRFIIYAFSHLKHLVKHSFNDILKDFYKRAEYNFYLQNLNEVFKGDDQPERFAFNANNQGTNSLRLRRCCYFQTFFLICAIYKISCPFIPKKCDIMRYETFLSSRYFYLNEK